MPPIAPRRSPDVRSYYTSDGWLLGRRYSTFNHPPQPGEKPNPRPKLNRNPLVLAQEWQQRLDGGEVTSRAELARQLGVSRARVT